MLKICIWISTFVICSCGFGMVQGGIHGRGGCGAKLGLERGRLESRGGEDLEAGSIIDWVSL